MRDRDETDDRTLRRGWTTGTCATVATRSALHALWFGEFLENATIRLPRGKTVTLPIHRHECGDDGGPWAQASVIKDAGDDPDITHGAEIIVTVKEVASGSGITFKAGEGIGTVTRPGLKLAVGEAAINPVPRSMMRLEVEDLARRAEKPADIEIEIAIPHGEEMAKQTLNPRLGIVGGLSVLGTTGVVIPFSCSSWIHSIHRGIDVARATGIEHVAAATGSTSEALIKKHYKLSDTALLDMGDFAGGTLKYLRTHPISHLTIAGGFGKLVKLAQGAMDLHSKRSSLDRDMIASWINDPELSNLAHEANTAYQILEKAIEMKNSLGDDVAKRARDQALIAADQKIAIEVIIYDREGRIAGHARGW